MLRVLVAEDSATARLLIVSLLSSDPALTVVGQAKNGEEAVAMCEALRPDVVTMDIQMPVMDGIEATRQIVDRWQTPVIMVSSLDPTDVSRSMLAFNAGALAVLAKPSGPGTPRFEKDCRELIATVKTLSEVKATPIPVVAATPVAPVAAVPEPPLPARADGGISIVGIVSSTGGPIALRSFFKELPTRFAAPIVIVQHIAAGFASAFAAWLASVSNRKVKVAADGAKLADGVIYIAPDDRHVTISSGAIVLTSQEPVDGARPSGSVLLASLAKSYGARAAGVLLSGNGVDGVAGLVAMHAAGAPTFVQDKETCTTFETPGAALEAGAVAHATPLVEIPKRLASLVSGPAEARA